MRYVDVECQVCKNKFNETDDVVVCPRCGTPHHRECWNLNNSCINTSLHDEGFFWQFPSTSKKVVPSAISQNTMNCKNCGKENPVGEPVCISCGERLYFSDSRIENQEKGQSESINNNPYDVNDSHYENPYTQRNTSQESNNYNDNTNENVLIDGIPAEEIAEYVQANSHKYIPKFLQIERDPNRKISWNWAIFFIPLLYFIFSYSISFIFTAVWFFYRKMYKIGFIVIALSLLLTAATTTKSDLMLVESMRTLLQDMASGKIEYSLEDGNNPLYDILEENQENIAEQNTFMPMFNTIVSSAALSVLVLFSNYWYKKKVKDSILKIRNQAHDMNTYHMLLAQKGGVSVFMGIVAAFVIWFSQGILLMIMSRLFL